MSINLEKRAEKVTIVLEKRKLKAIPPVRVGLVVDTSGSARGLFQSGTMQETVDRLLAVAMKFDDNGELDMWHFNSAFASLKTAVKDDYGSYVNGSIMSRRDLWGGTVYSDVMQAVVDNYFPAVKAPVARGLLGGLFGKKEAATTAAAELPAMCFFITDGQCGSNERATEAVLRAAQDKNVYWNMVGVGDAREFKFLVKMADALPNVGFVNLNSLSITDEQIYEELISEEFCEWVKKF